MSVGEILICILGPILLPSTGTVGCQIKGPDGLPLPVVSKPIPVCTCGGSDEQSPSFKGRGHLLQTLNPNHSNYMFMQLGLSFYTYSIQPICWLCAMLYMV